jgi:serine/threonine-protein phosphatase 2A regulatory subunit B''
MSLCLKRVNSDPNNPYIDSVAVAREYVKFTLSKYDNVGDDCLRETEVEKYIKDCLPTFKKLTPLDEKQRKYFPLHALRKFFFFLDPKRTGKIPIDVIVKSPIMAEMQELKSGLESDRNWFSYAFFTKIYSQFVKLDLDMDMQLDRRDLAGYNNYSFTETFVNRIFEETPLKKEKIDYRGYLDLMLAVYYKKTEPSLHFFWKILDVQRKGFITVWNVNFFMRDVLKQLQRNGINNIRLEDVRDEIFDMLKPEDPFHITFQDLKKSKSGDVVCSMLTDINGFWAYENRESLAAQNKQ